jgi:predicted nucleic acid-binding protein
MTEFVLDCSVTMGWCFADEADALSQEALELLGDGTAHVPQIWSLEIANVLLVAERRRRITKSDSARFCELLRSLPIVEELSLLGRENAEHLLGVGRQYELSAYDAAYLDLAMRSGLPLATRDRRLHTAGTQAGVKLLTPSI